MRSWPGIYKFKFEFKAAVNMHERMKIPWTKQGIQCVKLKIVVILISNPEAKHNECNNHWLGFAPVVSVNRNAYLRAKAPADPGRYPSAYCIQSLALLLTHFTLYERTSAPTITIECVLRPHPSNSVICCKPYQETKHKSLSFTREYLHPTKNYLLFNNEPYVNAVFEYFGTVALPYVHGLSQFPRSYRFSIKKTIPERKELYIAIKE